LNNQELAELDRQPASTKSNGGFQSMLVRFATRVDRVSGYLVLPSRCRSHIFKWLDSPGGTFFETAIIARMAFSRPVSAFAPALVKEFQSFEEVGLPQGLLPQGAYPGDKPPRLTDYLDDLVAADTSVPVVQKMVVVQGLELSSVG
jgi:hypothetical protein